MRLSDGGKQPTSPLVKHGDYLIEPRPFAMAGGWSTHVQIWRDFGGHVSSAQLASKEIAYTREEADRRCVERAIRAIEGGLELR
jgi:hypothetical protein